LLLLGYIRLETTFIIIIFIRLVTTFIVIRLYYFCNNLYFILL